MEKELDPDWSKFVEELARLQIELARAMPKGNSGRKLILKQIWDEKYPELERALGEHRALEIVKFYVEKIQQESEGVPPKQPPPIIPPPEETEPEEPEEPGDTTGKIINAFGKRTPATPLGKLRELIENIGAGWESDDETPEKAYALACFSELAYLHLAAYELQDRDRYKIFPSSTLRDLIASSTKIDLKQVVSAIAEDIKIQIVERPHFVYQLFDAPRFVAVSVRGSTPTWEDWRINFNGRKYRVDNGSYHLGFYQEAEDSQKDLLQLMSRVDGKPLYFTGHSLGGAIAAILAQIWPDRSRVMRPYIYAAPRFSSSTKMLDKPPFSYVAPYDLVPHVPPRWMGFADTGSPPRVVPKGTWYSGRASLFHWISLGKNFSSPHQIEGYRHNLGRTIKEYYSETVYIDALIAEQGSLS